MAEIDEARAYADAVFRANPEIGASGRNGAYCAWLMGCLRGIAIGGAIWRDEYRTARYPEGPMGNVRAPAGPSDAELTAQADAHEKHARAVADLYDESDLGAQQAKDSRSEP